MAPKAATTPIAMAVAQGTGGIPSLTAVGTADSGIGAARALPLHGMAGAFAGLAVGLNGLLTAIFVPIIIHFWPGN